MLSLVWLALLFILFVNVVGGVHVFRTGRSTWNELKAFAAFAGRASVALAARADAAAAKAERLDTGGERLAEATVRLERSLAYAEVLMGAVGKAQAMMRRARRKLPRK
jgi:hypothetical protein